jgi:hypothetical protein
MRHSIAWPRISMSRCVNGSFSPAATRICICTMSMPVTSLGHRVLDLHAGVHLDEVELAVLVQELEGAGAAVADLAAGRGAAVADALDHAARAMPGAGASSMIFWWRRCIEQSRSPSQTALRGRRPAPGSRCGAGSRGTSPCRRPGCRRRAGLGAGGLHRVEQRRLGVHHAHAAPAAAAGGLDDHRVADLRGRCG